MTGVRAIWLVLALALLTISGIIGMLLAQECLDALFFAMASAPLVVGAGYWWWLGRAAKGVSR